MLIVEATDIPTWATVLPIVGFTVSLIPKQCVRVPRIIIIIFA